MIHQISTYIARNRYTTEHSRILDIWCMSRKPFLFISRMLMWILDVWNVVVAALMFFFLSISVIVFLCFRFFLLQVYLVIVWAQTNWYRTVESTFAANANEICLRIYWSPNVQMKSFWKMCTRFIQLGKISSMNMPVDLSKQNPCTCACTTYIVHVRNCVLFELLVFYRSNVVFVVANVLFLAIACKLLFTLKL